MKRILRSVALALITLAITGILGEVMLRIKNSDQQNYTIEMWRYANELKELSPNPKFGHVHVPNRSARLQGIDISINSLGMRGPEPDLGKTGDKKILLLGSSITLGWGVPEEQSLRGQLESKLGKGFRVFNGAVGNYNVSRSVALFKEAWRKTIKPDVVVVHYFINDAEYLPPGTDNVFVRNSQLAVILYYIVQGFLRGSYDLSALIEHYRKVYLLDSRGYKEMRRALADLRAMAEADGFKVVFAMIPDIHQLQSYPFGFIHKQMRGVVGKFGWGFVDFLDSLKGYEGPELWTIPGDPHPNGLVHGLMAEQLLPYVR